MVRLELVTITTTPASTCRSFTGGKYQPGNLAGELMLDLVAVLDDPMARPDKKKDKSAISQIGECESAFAGLV